jgi:hypothetical protein
LSSLYIFFNSLLFVFLSFPSLRWRTLLSSFVVLCGYFMFRTHFFVVLYY